MKLVATQFTVWWIRNAHWAIQRCYSSTYVGNVDMIYSGFKYATTNYLTKYFKKHC